MTISRTLSCLLLALLPLAMAPSAARAGTTSTPQLESGQCGITTAYDVLVDSGGVWLRHGPLPPHDVFFHDGELSLDGKVVPVADSDAARLRELEMGARRLMPAATELARESVDLTFDALDGVVEVLTGNTNSRKVKKLRADARAWVEGSLGRGYWQQDTFGEGFEARVEAMAESLAASMTRSVLWQVFTGRAGNMERRADRMDEALEQRLEARGQRLEAQATALCPRVQALADVHDALQVRYQGQPLRLLERSDGLRVSR